MTPTSSGSSLTGIVTSITAGSGISINQSTGNVTITSLGGGGGENLDQTLGTGNTSSKGMSVGVVTATSFVKSGGTSSQFLKADGSVDSNSYLTSTSSGSSLTGIVTSITAGSGISIDQSTGNVTITATGGGGGGESYWVSTAAGIHTLSNVGVGTTNPTNALTVQGNVSVSGVSTLSTTNISGDLTFTGNNDLYLKDNGVINFGDANDLQIFHNGSLSIIRDGGTGGLLIDSDNEIKLAKNGTGNDNLAVFTPDGPVELYYDNSKKFETLGAGVTVTGTTFTNQLSVSGVSTFTNGPILIGSGTLTGTSSQPLQVTGGAYISGSLGIGRTNPGIYSLDVNGVVRIGGAASGKVSFGTGMAAGEFGLQILPYSDRTELQAEQQGTSYRPLSLNPFGGNVGVGLSNPSYKLDVTGAVRLGNSVAQGVPSISDISTNAHTLLSGQGGNYLSIGQYGPGNSYAQWIQSGFVIPSTATYNIVLQPLGGNLGIGATNPSTRLHVIGDSTVSGVTNLNQITETVVNAFNTALAPSTGTLTVDTSLGTVVLGDLNASVTTWAFTNVPTANSKATTITLIIDGDTAQTYGDACNVNGSAVSGGVKWSGGSAPTATNNFDIITFTIVKDSAGTINVFGSGNTNFS